MKNRLIVLTCILSSWLFSQEFNHIEYKQAYNNAYSIAAEKPEQAIKEIKANRKEFKTIYAEEMLLLAKCYLNLDKKRKSARLLRKAWKNNFYDIKTAFSIDEIKYSSFNNVNSKWHKWKMSKENKKTQKKFEYENSERYLYFVELDSLDQLYRSQMIEIQNNNQKYDSLEVLMKYQDSLNLRGYQKFIMTNGYPGEKMFPMSNDVSATILNHSTACSWFVEEMYPVLQKEVVLGNMAPSSFLYWLDIMARSNRKPGFYMLPNDVSGLSKEEIKTIKSERLKFGVVSSFPIPGNMY